MFVAGDGDLWSIVDSQRQVTLMILNERPPYCDNPIGWCAATSPLSG